MIRIVVAAAAVVGIAAGATPAMAAPVAPAPAVIAESGSAGTGSSAVDMALGFALLLICGPWGSTEPHPNPMCRSGL